MPRHFIYDAAMNLVAKSGTIDFKTWTQESFGDNTPWGSTDSPAIVTAVESQLERRLSTQVMREGAKPRFRKITAGDTLVVQGEPGDELFLLLDGVLGVEVDSEPIAEVGPGSILGERALIEGTNRTSTLRAVTPVRVAVVSAAEIQPEALRELATSHRREDA